MASPVNEFFSLAKFLKGYNIFNGQSAGKILYISSLVAVGGFILWSAFIKPTRNDVQTVSQKMDFQGATIEHLQMTTAERNEPSERRWSIGIYVESAFQGEVTAGTRLDFRF